MKAPSKGTSAQIKGYGQVTVKSGPSPGDPRVYFEHGMKKYDSLHIDEWRERRIQ